MSVPVPTMTVDSNQFNALAKRLLDHSHKMYPDFINGRGLAVASKALRNTKKASASKIKALLGEAGFTRNAKMNKRGRVVATYLNHGSAIRNTMAYRIIVARIIKSGGRPASTASIEEAAKKLIAAAVKSVAFIKSGWIPAIKELAALVYDKPREYSSSQLHDAEVVGIPKGGTTPARFKLKGEIFCNIWNTALITVGKRSILTGPSNPLPIAELGLNLAMASEMKEMEEHLARKLNPIIEDFNKGHH
jgi:hypothetical protein